MSIAGASGRSVAGERTAPGAAAARRGAHPSAAAVWSVDADADERNRSSLYDPLTGLALPALCLDRLALALAADVRQQAELAVLALSPLPLLDAALPTHQHALQLLGRWLGRAIRVTDTAAHFGAGRCVVVLHNIATLAAATRVAERLLDGVPLARGAAERGIPALALSAGVAYSPLCEGAADASWLLAEAVAAWAKAWQVGPHQVQVVREQPIPQCHLASASAALGKPLRRPPIAGSPYPYVWQGAGTRRSTERQTAQGSYPGPCTAALRGAGSRYWGT